MSAPPLPVKRALPPVSKSALKATVPPSLSLTSKSLMLLKELLVSAILVKVRAKASLVVNPFRDRPTPVAIAKCLIPIRLSWAIT